MIREPDELPDCSTPQLQFAIIEAIGCKYKFFGHAKARKNRMQSALRRARAGTTKIRCSYKPKAAAQAAMIRPGNMPKNRIAAPLMVRPICTSIGASTGNGSTGSSKNMYLITRR